MATIKITTANNLPRFVDGGLSVGSGWQDVDLDSLTESQRATLTQYTGTHIRVHDESMDTFRQYLSSQGMSYDEDGGKVVDPKREEAERQRAQADADAQAAARGEKRPTPPRDDSTGFQGPPGSEGGRVVDQTSALGADREVRDRDNSPTDPQKPSNKARPR